VINNLDEAKQAKLKELKEPPASDEIMQQLKDAQETIARLQETLRDAFELDAPQSKMKKIHI